VGGREVGTRVRIVLVSYLQATSTPGNAIGCVIRIKERMSLRESRKGFVKAGGIIIYLCPAFAPHVRGAKAVSLLIQTTVSPEDGSLGR